MKRLSEKSFTITPSTSATKTMMVEGLPPGHRVRKLSLVLEISELQRGAGAVPHVAETFRQVVRNVTFEPSNSKISMSCQAHRLGLIESQLNGGKRRNYRISETAVNGNHTVDIFFDPMPKTKQGKMSRPYSEELNGSSISIPFNLGAPFAATDITSMTVKAILTAYTYEPTDEDPGDNGARIVITESDGFEGSVLKISDVSPIMVLVKSNDFTSVSCSVNGKSVYTSATPYMLSGYDWEHQGVSVPFREDGVAYSNDSGFEDPILAQFPELNSVGGTDTSAGWTKLLYLPNQKDAGNGQAKFTFEGLTSPSSTPYVVLGVR